MNDDFFPNRGRKTSYYMNVLKGMDQTVGTWWGIDCDQHISTWVGIHRKGSWLYKLINWLFHDPDHCDKSASKGE